MRRRHFEEFRFLRFHTRAGERGGALKHGDVADEIAFARSRQNLLRVFTQLVNFQLAAQDHGERKVTLAGAENHLAAFADAPFA